MIVIMFLIIVNILPIVMLMLRMVTLPGDEQSSCSARQTSRKMDPEHILYSQSYIQNSIKKYSDVQYPI